MRWMFSSAASRPPHSLLQSADSVENLSAILLVPATHTLGPNSRAESGSPTRTCGNAGNERETHWSRCLDRWQRQSRACRRDVGVVNTCIDRYNFDAPKPLLVTMAAVGELGGRAPCPDLTWSARSQSAVEPAGQCP